MLGSGSGSGCRGAPLLETFPAEDRTALRRLERDRGLLAAAGAVGPGFYLRAAAGHGDRRAQSGSSPGLAGFATFGFVLELLVVEEELLTGGEDEVGAAVNALQNLVLEFHGEVLPSARGSRAMNKGKHNFQEDRAERPCCQSQLPVLRYISLGSAHHARKRMVTTHIGLRNCPMKNSPGIGKSKGRHWERRPIG
jgi:hypothetical protein